MNRLHKSKNNRVLLGVCGGLADTLGVDAPLLRIGFVLGAIFSGSLLFWIYLLLALILPSRD